MPFNTQVFLKPIMSSREARSKKTKKGGLTAVKVVILALTFIPVALIVMTLTQSHHLFDPHAVEPHAVEPAAGTLATAAPVAAAPAAAAAEPLRIQNARPLPVEPRAEERLLAAVEPPAPKPPHHGSALEDAADVAWWRARSGQQPVVAGDPAAAAAETIRANPTLDRSAPPPPPLEGDRSRGNSGGIEPSAVEAAGAGWEAKRRFIGSEPVSGSWMRDCPAVPPPGYPQAYPIMDIVNNWSPDRPTPVPPTHYHALCRFDYKVPS
jgi:hypothetical protein